MPFIRDKLPFLNLVTHISSPEYYGNDIVLQDLAIKRRDNVLSDKEYVIHSLETNFFLKNSKEHLNFCSGPPCPQETEGL